VLDAVKYIEREIKRRILLISLKKIINYLYRLEFYYTFKYDYLSLLLTTFTSFLQDCLQCYEVVASSEKEGREVDRN